MSEETKYCDHPNSDCNFADELTALRAVAEAAIFFSYPSVDAVYESKKENQIEHRSQLTDALNTWRELKSPEAK